METVGVKGLKRNPGQSADVIQKAADIIKYNKITEVTAEFAGKCIQCAQKTKKCKTKNTRRNVRS